MSKRALDEEQPVKGERASQRKKSIRKERAVGEEEPIQPERASANEQPRARERAIDTEKPVAKERATGTEKPTQEERASAGEKPVRGERAIVKEKPEKGERATSPEKPIQAERAIIKEKPAKGERATDEERPIKPERALTSLSYLSAVAMGVEKLRVSCQVRLSHLARLGRIDPLIEEVLHRLVDLEGFTDRQLKEQLYTHPAYPWFSRVRGLGAGEVIAKIIGEIDIERADTVSSLWKFAGLAPVDGKAERRVKGRKQAYNARLRTLCFRMGKNLLLQEGVFYEYYVREKAAIRAKKEAEGYRVMPTPKGRYCPQCEEEVAVATALYCPTCHGRLSPKGEPPNVLYELHLHMMAQRKMIKMALAMLYLTWRSGLGLPVSRPYAQAVLGHPEEGLITPEMMVDRPVVVEQGQPGARRNPANGSEPIARRIP